jgi:hypothetical protein
VGSSINVNDKPTVIVPSACTTSMVTDSETHTGMDAESGGPDAAIFSAGGLWLGGGGAFGPRLRSGNWL